MTPSAAECGGIEVLKLEGALHVSGVAALKARMLDHLQTCRTLILDVEAVDDCDTAAAQLIVAACRQELPAGKRIRLGAHSAAIAAIAGKLGLRLPVPTETNQG